MVQIGNDNIIRALKGFKGIAKQELLTPETTPQAQYRKTHAEARREIYTKLIDLVEQSGIENACVFAFSEYRELPISEKLENEIDPVASGKVQALEMFFNVMGLQADQLRQLKSEKVDFSQVLTSSPPNNLYV